MVVGNHEMINEVFKTYTISKFSCNATYSVPHPI